MLTSIDIAIILVYVASLIVVGFYMRRRASRSIEDYFLGGRRIPWWVLGMSNSISMYDITGTMYLVAIFFIYGVKAMWIPFMWPIYNVIFSMAYLGPWIRRSKAMTAAEWMRTRFGTDRGGELSRLAVTVFALANVIGLLAYAFQGIGKFAQTFLPWGLPPEAYSVIIMGLTGIYIVVGGMYSVVYTDIVQSIILLFSAIFIAVLAFFKTNPETIAANTPEGWLNVFPEWELSLDWSGLIPQLDTMIHTDGFHMLGALLLMWMFKGFLHSMGVVDAGYDFQRQLAAKSSREAAKLNAVTPFFLVFRFGMVAGITALGVSFYFSTFGSSGGAVDFERLLPEVIGNYIPIGVKGFLLAGLLAAFMSTFDSTVNSGSAYLVKDVYQRYLRPAAGGRELMRASYLTSILVIVVGTICGFFAESVTQVWEWLVVSIWGAAMVPSFLRWYWWRFNGTGYFSGMMAGLLTGFLHPVFFPGLSPFVQLPAVALISLTGCIIGTYLTPPTDRETLKAFYHSVRPWGLWKAVDPEFKSGARPGLNMGNACIGIVGMFSLYLVPVYLVYHRPMRAVVALALAVTVVAILKKTWWETLPTD